MNSLKGFDTLRAYIVKARGKSTNHMMALEKVLKKLAEPGLKINADKSFF